MISRLDAWIARRLHPDAQDRETPDQNTPNLVTPNLVTPDPDAVRAAQLQGVRRTVARLRAHSPLLRERLAHLPQGAPARWQDIAVLPFTLPQDLRGDPARLLCTSQGEVRRVVSLNTSGTTGGPKRIFFDDNDLESTLEFFSVGMSQMARRGDTVLVLIPGRSPDGASDLLRRALERLGARPLLPPPQAAPEELARMILDNGVTCLAAMPFQLARLLAEASSALAGNAVRTVMLSGEVVPVPLRQRARELGWTVFAHYGLTETGFGGGVECGAHQGYHLRELDILVEIVDPLTGEPCPDGERGEVALTTLNRRAMPLLRYRTGDVARVLPGPCPCGSPMRRLGEIEGRLVLQDGGLRIEQPNKGTSGHP